MKRFEQEFLHDPGAGVMGDCFRACVATVLSHFEPDIELADVPHFARDSGPEDMVAFALTWLDRRGYDVTDERFEVRDPTRERGREGNLDSAENSLSRLAAAFARDEVYIATGVSPRFPDLLHSVVMRGACMHHDPHADKRGVWGIFHVTWIRPRNAPQNHAGWEDAEP